MPLQQQDRWNWRLVVVLLCLVLALAGWHFGVAHWRLRRQPWNPGLWLSGPLAAAGGWWWRRVDGGGGEGVKGRGGRRLAAWTLLWVLCGVVSWCWWRTISSPLLRSETAVAALAVSGWWTIALAVAIHRGDLRSRVGFAGWSMVALLAVMGAQSGGLDGDGRAILRWREGDTASETAVSPPQPSWPVEPSWPAARVVEFPAYRGRERTGVVEHLHPFWSDAESAARGGLVPLWRRPLGSGWSGYVVSGGLAVTQQQTDDGEYLTAQLLDSGREAWRIRIGAAFSSAGGPGPRATPTVAGPLVAAMGAAGRLTVRRLADGSEVWGVDVLHRLGSANRPHGCAASPLIVDDLVVVGGGESAAGSAWRIADGSPAWVAGEGPDSYASPMLWRAGEQPQVVLFAAREVIAIEPASGEVLWTFAWANSVETNCAQPLPAGPHRLLLSSGYGLGSVLLEVRREQAAWTPREVWRSDQLQAKFASPVLIDDVVVGLHQGVLTALQLEDGRRLWKQGRFGHGQLLWLAEQRVLLVQNEAGSLHALRVDRNGFQQLGEIRPWTARTWNHPCPAGGYLILRNDREAAAYRWRAD